MSEHPEHQSKQERDWSKEIQRLELALAESETRYARLLAERIVGQERMREAAQEVITKWDHNVGRVMESMGSENPRVEAIDEAIEKLRVALSDVTEQKDLGDCPEPLGRSERGTNIYPLDESL